MLSVPRVLRTLYLPSSLRSLLLTRMYATQTGLGASNADPTPKRKAVTMLNDDGRVAWSDLSTRERAARASQQTVNFSMIIIGATLTGAVVYLMYTEVFSSDSKTSHFNRAVDRVKGDPRCIELLGPSKKITAYGEHTWSKWARVRPIASSTKKDVNGTEHLTMHFNMEGPLSKGIVYLHVVKRPSQQDFEYKYLYLDVKGHQRIYLENMDASANGETRRRGKVFGIKWTR